MFSFRCTFSPQNHGPFDQASSHSSSFLPLFFALEITILSTTAGQKESALTIAGLPPRASCCAVRCA